MKILLLSSAPEDNQVAVFNAIGGYCARQAQSFTEDRREPDIAQDYALEGAVYQSTTREFPVMLYFYTSVVRHLRETAGSSWRRFQSGDRPERILNEVAIESQLEPGSPPRMDRAAAVAADLLRLARSNHATALALFSRLPERTADSLLTSLATRLAVNDVAGTLFERFERLLGEYNRRMNILIELLDHGAAASNLGAVGTLSTPLEEARHHAAPLLWLRERQTLEEVGLAAAYTMQAESANDPAVRRSLLNTARIHLDRVSVTGRELSFGLSYVLPLAESWQHLVRQAIEETRELIRPGLATRPYLHTYRRRGSLFEAQFQLRNEGQGLATAIEVVADADEPGPLDVALEKASLGSKEEQLILVSGPAPTEGKPLSLSLRILCRDVEGNREEFQMNAATLAGTPPDLDFESERGRNPFNAGDVVKDPRMFHGREAIIEQLVSVTAAQSHRGALRLLFGQRRVGKSSILYFLERRLNAVDTPLTVCAHVTWLNFAQHRPGNVLFEIARQLRRSAVARSLDVSHLRQASYERSYSREFNELLALRGSEWVKRGGGG